MLEETYNLYIRLKCIQRSNRHCRSSVCSAVAESFNEVI